VASNLSVYGRYERGYTTNGVNPSGTAIILMEGGITYADYGFIGTLRGFRTLFDNQSFGGGVDLDNPNLNTGFFADSTTNGVDFDGTYRPQIDILRPFSLHVQATWQDPKFSNVSIGTTDINNQQIASAVNTFYDGKTTGHTPKVLYTITPSYDLPANYGQVYMRYKYVGKVFADNGNQVVLPGYGVLTIGAIANITPNLALNVSVDNVTNVLGLTEGNPRAGFTQTIVNNYFYGRGIVGPTALASLTYKF
jgi:hypothetical protein